MEQYHKIQTVYLRDPKTNFKTLLEGEWSLPEFELLKDIEWIGEEKIDGTNIRILYNGSDIIFKGKTDRAQIPKHLEQKLKEIFTQEKMSEVFTTDPDKWICLYGEGYGYKIQKGYNYIEKDVNFILFDVKIGRWWLDRDVIHEIAEQLDIKTAPVIRTFTLKEAIEYVRKGFKSTIAQNKDYMAEGLVLRPKYTLFDRSGRRIITKIKHKDFK